MCPCIKELCRGLINSVCAIAVFTSGKIFELLLWKRKHGGDSWISWVTGFTRTQAVERLWSHELEMESSARA